jgi:hypothetical protein
LLRRTRQVVAKTVTECHGGCVNDDLAAGAARDALLAAARSSEKLRIRARWVSTKLTVFGVAIGLVTVAVGLIESKLWGAAVFGGWMTLAVVMSAWERRRLAHLPGTRERASRYVAMSFAFYGVALAVGIGQGSADPAYWLPAGAIFALPMLVGAFGERHA